MKPLRTTILAALLVGTAPVFAAGPERSVEIVVGMDFDAAAKILRESGAQEGHLFSAVYVSPPVKWSDFVFPDHRAVTLHGAPSEIFPSIFRVTAIVVIQPNKADLGQSNLREERENQRVDRFVVPAKAP